MIPEMINALKAGEELKNPAKWKNRGENAVLVGAVLDGAIAFVKWKYPDLLPVDDTFLAAMVDYSTQAIWSVVGAIMLYLNRATTKKDF